MEIIGTAFSITLGGWRIRLCFALEDTDAAPNAASERPHHLRVARQETRTRGRL
jgi:hypothetical protein